MVLEHNVLDEEPRSVVVIGAGLSGLQAANRLSQHFPDIVVLEASSQIGGRIRQVDNVADWPVQLGPEFIHGAKSSLKRILEEIGCQCQEYEWPDYWYFGNERLLIRPGNQDEDLQRVHELFASVGKTAPPRTDISAMHWLKMQNANSRMVAIAEACYANDFGCSLDQLGLHEMITENQRWDSGDTYLVLDRCLSSIVEHLHSKLEGRTRTSWPVSCIEYSDGSATVHGPSGQRLRARHVIVTVPILALQNGSISFKPALPRAKGDAIARIRMSNAVKVILAFSRPFWPAHFFDVVCTDCFIPEFWVTSYPATAQDSSNLHSMVGFIAGKKAEDLSSMRHSNIILNALKQLDQIFGCQQVPRPATGAFVRGHVADWSKVPWIGGAYSYPTLGAHPGDRDALAAPVGSVLFFAGEATHPAVNPCMQAALETGERAAEQILAHQNAACSKL
ncbi:hypothetical protein CVIRNUC_006594 [Coccomyxa viridis]|uniref:Amine oxidase domain-containing protein n=1 Tax=Coccomyxa viridis TaxID=1274662 RepID=A0AAV1IBJ4_9CHLO|nr:hypothetical protein CVIRNUC_006594 [Coccomyxa viridis]